jgi:putative flippase GtrA
LLSIVLVVFFQFLINKYLTFKPVNHGESVSGNASL